MLYQTIQNSNCENLVNVNLSRDFLLLPDKGETFLADEEIKEMYMYLCTQGPISQTDLDLAKFLDINLRLRS